MPRPPERILLFRSGRHLQTAIAALRAASPGCEITVVARTEAAAALDQAGIAPALRLVYDRTPFFQPWPFITSPAGRRALAGRFDRVCVLWNGPDGDGQANVDYTALTVSPLGYTAITPDGTLLARRTAATLRREAARAALSLAVGAFLGVTLFLPARLLGVWSRTERREAA
jgi:hypothetical protein